MLRWWLCGGEPTCRSILVHDPSGYQVAVVLHVDSLLVRLQLCGGRLVLQLPEEAAGEGAEEEGDWADKEGRGGARVQGELRAQAGQQSVLTVPDA